MRKNVSGRKKRKPKNNNSANAIEMWKKKPNKKGRRPIYVTPGKTGKDINEHSISQIIGEYFSWRVTHCFMFHIAPTIILDLDETASCSDFLTEGEPI